MSEMQIYLLAFGLAVIVGVFVFNRLQERRFRKKLDKKGEQGAKDPLLDQISESDKKTLETTRLSPSETSGEPVEGEIVKDSFRADSRPIVTDEDLPIDLEFLDPAITFQIDLTSPEGLCISSTGRLQEVLSSITKRHQVLGSNRKEKESVIISDPDSIFEKLKIVVQLTDRNGAMTKDEIESIATNIYSESVPTGAIATQIKVDVEAERAADLKQFSDDVDLLFGLTVERPRGVSMPGVEVLSLAKSLGMRLNRFGVFIMPDSDGKTLFSLENRDSTPFVESQLTTQELSGITFLLDVTTAIDGIKTFNKMAGVAKQFSDAMNASICDDNSHIVNDAGLDMIRQQLGKIYSRMEEQGILPGTLVAEQLFS